MKEDDIKAAVNCKPGAIESILAQVQHTVRAHQSPSRLKTGVESPSSLADFPRAAPLHCPIQIIACFLPPTLPSNNVIVCPTHSPQIMEYQKGKDGHAATSPVAAGRHELSESVPYATSSSSSSSSAAAHSSGSVGPSGSSAAATTHHHSAGGSGGSEIAERDATIVELRETVDILELKVQKLEQLIKLKDGRIQTLLQKLQAGAVGGGGH